MQVVGVQVGVTGVVGMMHEARSKSMNSSIFSCGVIAPPGHSAGKILPPVVVLLSSSTWKSLKRPRPHWEAGGLPTGVSNVMCMGTVNAPVGAPPRLTHSSVGAFTPVKSSRRVLRGICAYVVDEPAIWSHCASAWPRAKLVLMNPV